MQVFYILLHFEGKKKKRLLFVHYIKGWITYSRLNNYGQLVHNDKHGESEEVNTKKRQLYRGYICKSQ